MQADKNGNNPLSLMMELVSGQIKALGSEIKQATEGQQTEVRNLRREMFMKQPATNRKPRTRKEKAPKEVDPRDRHPSKRILLVCFRALSSNLKPYNTVLDASTCSLLAPSKAQVHRQTG